MSRLGKGQMNLNLAFILIYSGMLEIGHGLHDAWSYPHLYLVLKDPLQGSFPFYFLFCIGAGIMVSVLCNHVD